MPSPNDTINAISKVIPGSAGKSGDMDHLWRAIRKLSNRDAMAVVNALANKSMTFGELQAATNLIVNDLNHALYDMKQMDLVITIGEKKGQRKYHLTNYCITLLNAVNVLRNALIDLDEEVFREHV